MFRYRERYNLLQISEHSSFFPVVNSIPNAAV